MPKLVVWPASLEGCGGTSGPNMGSRLFQRNISSLFLQGHQVQTSSLLRLGFTVFRMKFQKRRNVTLGESQAVKLMNISSVICQSKLVRHPRCCMYCS